MSEDQTIQSDPVSTGTESTVSAEPFYFGSMVGPQTTGYHLVLLGTSVHQELSIDGHFLNALTALKELRAKPNCNRPIWFSFIAQEVAVIAIADEHGLDANGRPAIQVSGYTINKSELETLPLNSVLQLNIEAIPFLNKENAERYQTNAHDIPERPLKTDSCQLPSRPGLIDGSNDERLCALNDELFLNLEKRLKSKDTCLFHVPLSDSGDLRREWALLRLFHLLTPPKTRFSQTFAIGTNGKVDLKAKLFFSHATPDGLAQHPQPLNIDPNLSKIRQFINNNPDALEHLQRAAIEIGELQKSEPLNADQYWFLLHHGAQNTSVFATLNLAELKVTEISEILENTRLLDPEKSMSAAWQGIDTLTNTPEKFVEVVPSLLKDQRNLKDKTDFPVLPGLQSGIRENGANLVRHSANHTELLQLLRVNLEDDIAKCSEVLLTAIADATDLIADNAEKTKWFRLLFEKIPQWAASSPKFIVHMGETRQDWTTAEIEQLKRMTIDGGNRETIQALIDSQLVTRIEDRDFAKMAPHLMANTSFTHILDFDQRPIEILLELLLNLKLRQAGEKTYLSFTAAIQKKFELLRKDLADEKAVNERLSAAANQPKDRLPIKPAAGLPLQATKSTLAKPSAEKEADQLAKHLVELFQAHDREGCDDACGKIRNVVSLNEVDLRFASIDATISNREKLDLLLKVLGTPGENRLLRLLKSIIPVFPIAIGVLITVALITIAVIWIWDYLQ